MKWNEDWIFTQSLNNHKKFAIITVCKDQFNISERYIHANTFHDFIIQSIFLSFELLLWPKIWLVSWHSVFFSLFSFRLAEQPDLTVSFKTNLMSENIFLLSLSLPKGFSSVATESGIVRNKMHAIQILDTPMIIWVFPIIKYPLGFPGGFPLSLPCACLREISLPHFIIQCSFSILHAIIPSIYSFIWWQTGGYRDVSVYNRVHNKKKLLGINRFKLTGPFSQFGDLCCLHTLHTLLLRPLILHHRKNSSCKEYTTPAPVEIEEEEVMNWIFNHGVFYLSHQKYTHRRAVAFISTHGHFVLLSSSIVRNYVYLAVWCSG